MLSPDMTERPQHLGGIMMVGEELWDVLSSPLILAQEVFSIDL